MRSNQKYAPIMYKFGFFEASVNEVVNNFIQWREWIEEKILIQQNIEVKYLSGTFDQAMLKLFPLQTDCNRFLFIPTKSKWTLYL